MNLLKGVFRKALVSRSFNNLFFMKKLSKLTIKDFDYESTDLLSRERMRAIKGGGGGCYVTCMNGYWTITQNCEPFASCQGAGEGGIKSCYGNC